MRYQLTETEMYRIRPGHDCVHLPAAIPTGSDLQCHSQNGTYWLAIAHLVVAALLAVTVIGIPFAVGAALAATTVVAVVATAGSLYLSLGLGLVPCDLCWYQRILMYPLVVVLGVAAWEDRVAVWRTAALLAVPGAGIATYHSYLQRTTTTCTFSGPCASIQYTVGPLTIPNLALLAFVLVLGALALAAVAGAGTGAGAGFGDRLG